MNSFECFLKHGSYALKKTAIPITVTHSNHSTESTDFGFVQSNSYHASEIVQDRVQNKLDPSFSTHGKEQDIERECFEQGPTP